MQTRFGENLLNIPQFRYLHPFFAPTPKLAIPHNFPQLSVADNDNRSRFLFTTPHKNEIVTLGYDSNFKVPSSLYSPGSPLRGEMLMIAALSVLAVVFVFVVFRLVFACVTMEREAANDGSSSLSEDDLRLKRIYRNGRSA